MLLDLTIIDGQLLLKVSTPVLDQATALLTKDIPLTRGFGSLGKFQVTQKEIGHDGCFKAIMISPSESYYTAKPEEDDLQKVISTVSLLGHYCVSDLQKTEAEPVLWKDQAFTLNYQQSSPALTGSIYPWLANNIRRLGKERRILLKKELREFVAHQAERLNLPGQGFEIDLGKEGFLLRLDKVWCRSKFSSKTEAKQSLVSELDDQAKQELLFLAFIRLNTWIHDHSRKKKGVL